LIKKLQGDLWRVCSICEMFFSWSLMVSIIDRFLNKILSIRGREIARKII